MQQNVHLLSTSGVGLPSDLWVPATKKVAPQKSYQLTAAYSRTLPNGYEASIEGYYKEMTHLITYTNGENWLDGGSDWQDRVETDGVGTSKGLEFFIHKKEGKFTGWIGYTLSKTDRQFSNVNNGVAYPYRYDRRHDVGILMSYKFNDRIEISGTWVYGTGNAITLGEARYLAHQGYSPYLDLPGQNYQSWNSEVEYYAGRNQFRMRAYHRSDLGLKFTKQKSWGERTWNWGFYNVYNRANPFYYYWADDYNSDARRLKQIALFPIIPSFSYEFKF
jgi:ribosome modulation factor